MHKTENILHWPRSSYIEGDQKPKLYYIIYGDTGADSFQVLHPEHQTEGIPSGIKIALFNDDNVEKMKWPFRDKPIKTILYNQDKTIFECAKISKIVLFSMEK